MLTKLNTHEGVPIGSTNFEDFMEYIRLYLTANFRFSVSAIQSRGGFFSDDRMNSVEYHGFRFLRPGVAPPNLIPAANIFGRFGDEFIQIKVLHNTGPTNVVQPKMYEWELIPDQSNTIGHLSYTNPTNWTATRQLPHRPVRRASPTSFEYGFYGISYNGVPQPRVRGTQEQWDYTTVPGSAPFTTSLEFTFLTLGAEYPKPELNERYAPALWETGITLNECRTIYNNTFRFEYTNFSQAHILLHRTTAGQERFYYLEEVPAGDGELLAGTYRVIDRARGIIHISLSTEIVDTMLGVNENNATARFYIVSAEELSYHRESGVTNYYTRYGNVFSGDTSNMLLVEHVYDGETHRVSAIESATYFRVAGDILLRDGGGRFSDSTILAIRYQGRANQDYLNQAQARRYNLDTIKLFYTTGISMADASIATVPDVQLGAILEKNQVSWYNRDVLGANFAPVPRGERVLYSLLTVAEATAASLLTTVPVFQPLTAFSIIDTIGMDNLFNVDPTGLADNVILKYNLAANMWTMRDHVLNELNDVRIGIPDVRRVADVLFWDGSFWTNRESTITPNPGALMVRNSGGLSQVNDPINPLDIANRRFVENTRVARAGDTMTGTLTLTPAQSIASRAIAFNHNYSIFADNSSDFLPAVNRLWVDGPNNGEIVIGPRTGGSHLSGIRLRSTSLMHETPSGNFTVFTSGNHIHPTEDGYNNRFLRRDVVATQTALSNIILSNGTAERQYITQRQLSLHGATHVIDARLTVSNNGTAMLSRGLNGLWQAGFGIVADGVGNNQNLRLVFGENTVLHSGPSGNRRSDTADNTWFVRTGGNTTQNIDGDKNFTGTLRLDGTNIRDFFGQSRGMFFGEVIHVGGLSARGNPWPTGWTVSDSHLGWEHPQFYTITHHLGTLNYVVFITVTGEGHIVSTVERSSNSFRVYGRWSSSGVYMTTPFFFMVVVV